jgi:hypothetical protein
MPQHAVSFTDNAQASFLFSLRVCALWQLRRRVMIPLCILALGQLAICMLSTSTMAWGEDFCWWIKPVSVAPYYGKSYTIRTSDEILTVIH